MVLDGLGMSIAESGDKIDWRYDSVKFVVLLTDEAGDMTNRYGYSNISDIAKTFANKGICVSVITEPYLFSSYNKYNLLWETTSGLFANIHTDFSTILLELADKVGEVTNQGEWVFLDDFQAVRLAAEDDENYGDTDKDGLGDYAELVTPVELDMLPFINQLKAKGGYTPNDVYTGKTELTVYKYLSNPILPDTDFDGINDNLDTKAKDNSFTGILYGDMDDKKISINVSFKVDYSLLLKDNTVYRDDLSVFTSLLVADIYTCDNELQSSNKYQKESKVKGTDRYVEVSGIGGDDDIIPILPLEYWDFTKYGDSSRHISVATDYEDISPFATK